MPCFAALETVSRLTHRQEDRHRLGVYTSRDEAEDRGQGPIKPLRVLDETQHRALLRDSGQQAQKGQSAEKPLPHRAVFPTPVSPRMTSASLSPARTLAEGPSSSTHSALRPTNPGPGPGWRPWLHLDRPENPPALPASPTCSPSSDCTVGGRARHGEGEREHQGSTGVFAGATRRRERQCCLIGTPLRKDQR